MTVLSGLLRTIHPFAAAENILLSGALRGVRTINILLKVGTIATNQTRVRDGVADENGGGIRWIDRECTRIPVLANCSEARNIRGAESMTYHGDQFW